MGHRSRLLDKYIGETVRITFNDGNACEGTLDRYHWRYGMHGADFYDATDKTKNRKIDGWLAFSKSNVKMVQLILIVKGVSA